MWKVAKRQIYGQRYGHPERMMENGQIKLGSKKVANVLNRYYVSKITTLRKDLPYSYIDPMISYRAYVTKSKNILKISKIRNEELNTIFKRVNKSRSTGVDNISMVTVMRLRKSIQKLILHLINQVIETKIFPECLKVSKIIPIKKNNEEDVDPKNYRPIN